MNEAVSSPVPLMFHAEDLLTTVHSQRSTNAMHPHHSRLLLVLFIGVVWLDKSYAQLNTQFNKVFSEILDARLRRSVGVHGTHFLEAADEANRLLTPALNSLIVSNISSFPLSSTIPAVTFDFSTGVPVPVTESLGPIFSETAETIGKGRMGVGFNYSFLDLSRVRGLPTEDMRFGFTHQDTNNDTTIGGFNPTENDVIDVVMGMNLHASIFALYATYGVTGDLDVGVAIPFINVNLNGTADATINSYTYARLQEAFHYFGGDSLNPVLETKVPYDASATGLGDIAVRLKYSFARGKGLDVAALADVRLPTGKEENFLGTGKTDFRVLGIVSKKFSDFIPHLNLGYEKRSANFQSDRIDFRAGFDEKVLSGLTFSLDVLGTVDLNSDKAIKLFPGTRTVVDQVIDPNTGNVLGRSPRQIDLSNVPERNDDNMYSLSAGFKYAPSEKVVVLANVLVPLNNGGLRASVAPTVGVSANF